MKAMLWKELRENLKWGALALLALIMAEFYALSSAHGSYSEDFRDLTLLSSAFLLVSAFGCSATGVALALVQILPEQKRDQWAALLHRPISRGTIFLGKAAAGLLLYFSATLLAFLASVAYVATPGQFAAPLVPGMLIPGFSDLFLGMAFYSGTLLICLDRGRWWTRRLAIGLSLIPLLALHLTAGLPFLLPLMASAVYLVAAWDSMFSNGGMQNRTRAGRLSLVIAVLAGAETAVLAFICALRFLPQGVPETSTPFVSFVISADGEVFLEKMNTEHGDIITTPMITTLDGKLLPSDKFKDFQGLIMPEFLCWDLHNDQSYRTSFLTRSPRNLADYLFENDDSQSKEIWYELVNQRYFIGYDKLSRRPVGICDRDGFKPPGSIPSPFPHEIKDSIMNFRSPHLYWVGTQLYAFDFLERTMTGYDTGGEHIYGAIDLSGDLTSEKPNFTVAAVQSGLRVFDSEGKPLGVFAYPRDPEVWTALSIATDEKAQRLFLQSSGSSIFWDIRSNKKKPPVPTYLDELSLNGQVLQSHSLPPDPEIHSQPSWAQQVTTLLSPFLPALVGKIHANLFPNSTATPVEILGQFSFPQPNLDPGRTDLVKIFALDLLLSLVVLGCALQVGFSKPRAVGWALLTASFGLPALFAFRCASDWPTRVRCPHCQAARPLDLEKCPHCHRPWPQPHATGIEIFEPAGQVKTGVA